MSIAKHCGANLAIIIRTAGERTENCCKHICEQIAGAENVIAIREAPFERALAKMCDVALARNATWTLSVDADVLLDAEAVELVLKKSAMLDRGVFHVQPPILCNLFGGIRTAGVRLFRTENLQRFRELIPSDGTEMRPETYVVNQMTAEGFRTELLPDVVGIHDFEQYYRDIYRKAFVHGQKHVSRLPILLPAWKQRSATDPAFQVAIRGATDGLLSDGNVVLDPTFYEERANIALQNIGLVEKGELAADQYSADAVTEIIRGNDWPIIDNKLKAVIANQNANRTIWNRLQQIPTKLRRSRRIRRYLGLPSQPDVSRRPRAA